MALLYACWGTGCWCPGSNAISAPVPTLLCPACSRRSQVPSGQLDALHASVGQRAAAFKQEYGQKEPQLEIREAAASNAASTCLTAAASQRVLDLLLTLPHGVIKNSHYVAGGWEGRALSGHARWPVQPRCRCSLCWHWSAGEMQHCCCC